MNSLSFDELMFPAALWVAGLFFAVMRINAGNFVIL